MTHTLLLACILVILSAAGILAHADITITDSFPDAELQSVISKNVDKNKDGVLTESEIAGCTSLSLESKTISNMKGIEHLTELTSLISYAKGSYTSLDLSNASKLNTLTVNSSGLTTLKLNSAAPIKNLNIVSDKLAAIDVSGYTGLQHLVLWCPALTSLDVSRNTELTVLQVTNSSIKGIDVTKNTKLITLSLGDSPVSTVNVSQNKDLVDLQITGTKVTSLDLSANTQLDLIDVHSNSLTGITLPKSDAVHRIAVYDNKLSYLDISPCSNLINTYRTGTKGSDRHSYSDGSTGETDKYSIDYYNFIECDKGLMISTDGKISIKITGAKVASIKDQTYTGSALKPLPTVTFNGAALTKDKDYSLSYKNNTNVGAATVTVTGKGIYTGSLNASFSIVPKTAKLISLKKAKKAFTVKWKKQSAKMKKSRITGYQIQYSTNSTFKSGNKQKTIKGYAKTSLKIKGLKSKKTYYVRIRTMMKTGGKTYYSAWSAKKKIKVK